MKLSIKSIEYTIENGKPVIYIYGRDEQKRRVVYKDTTLLPFFFIRTKDRLSLPSRLCQIVSVEGGYKHFITNEDLSKVTLIKPSEVRILRDYLEARNIPTYQSDILFPDVYCIVNDVKSGIEIREDGTRDFIDFYVEPRVLYLDIETESKSITLPNPRHNRILTIGMLDSYTNEIIILKNDKVPNINTEAKMLAKMIEYIDRVDPDIISGFNIVGFDIPFILERMSILNINKNFLSPLNLVRIHQNGRIEIKGREIFDLAVAYRQYNLKELEEDIPKALHSICLKHFGIGQIKFDKPMSEVWKEDMDKVVEHCKRDLELCKRLNDELKLLDFYDRLRCYMGVRFRYVFEKYKLVEPLIIKEYNKNKFILNNRPSEDNGDTSSYIGSINYAVPGYYNNVLVLDFVSFYPNIIRYYNISPETYTTNGEYRVDDNHTFTGSKEGVFPRVLSRFLSYRKMYKGMLKSGNLDENTKNMIEIQSTILKYVINSIYGTIGYSTSRWYMKDIAESVTLGARKHITELANKLSQSFKLVYIDTDSVFIELGNSTPEDVLKEIALPPPLELEIANQFKDLIILTKKRYAGMDTSGKIIIKGMECIRTETPPLIASLQRSIIEMIFNKVPKEDIIRKIKGTLKDIKAMKVPILDLCRRPHLSKRPTDYKVRSYHVQAMNNTKSLFNVGINPGSRIPVLPIKGNLKWLYIPDTINWDDIMQKNIIIDYNLIEEWIKSAIIDIIKYYNIDWDIHIKNQLTLDNF